MSLQQLLVSNSYDLQVSDLGVKATTASTSVSTGALVVSGGLGVASAINAGGAIRTTLTTASTGTDSGALLVSGGAGISGAMNVGDAVKTNSTVESTNTATGALQVLGGVGIAKSVKIGLDCAVGGTLTKGGGAFDIVHPDPEKVGWRLRHCFVESNTRGDNIYRFKIQTDGLTGSVALPSYFKFLNENEQVFISGTERGSYGCGSVDVEQTQVNIEVNVDGVYNVLVIATRKDALMRGYWDEHQEELPPTHQC